MTTTKIISIITKTPNCTANHIAKECGISKANDKIKGLIAELIQAGSIVADESGRYVTYMIAEKKSAPVEKKVESAPVKKETVASTPVVDDGMTKVVKEIPVKELRGFKVAKTKTSVMITIPSGKTVNLGPTDYLLIINDKPEYKVNSPADVMKAINDYSTKKGYRTFVCSDIAKGKKSVAGNDDVDMPEDHLLFFEIKPHNKAA